MASPRMARPPEAPSLAGRSENKVYRGFVTTVLMLGVGLVGRDGAVSVGP